MIQSTVCYVLLMYWKIKCDPDLFEDCVWLCTAVGKCCLVWLHFNNHFSLKDKKMSSGLLHADDGRGEGDLTKQRWANRRAPWEPVNWSLGFFQTIPIAGGADGSMWERDWCIQPDVEGESRCVLQLCVYTYNFIFGTLYMSLLLGGLSIQPFFFFITFWLRIQAFNVN